MKVHQPGNKPVQSQDQNPSSRSEGAKGRRPERHGASAAASSAGAPARVEKTLAPKSEQVSEGEVALGAAKLNISAKARDAVKAKDLASNAPDVREQKIAELREKIASGRYHVDAAAIADKMVDDHLSMPGIG